MAKPSITTRATKGSALSWTEGDTNLENLRDATITVRAGSAGTSVVSDLNGTVTLVAGTNISLSGDNTEKTVTISVVDLELGAGGGIASVLEDTTPQLGGDLDVGTHSIITSETNGDIAIVPDGTGSVLAQSDTLILGALTDPEAVITTDGETSLILDTNDGTDSGSITITAGADGDIEISPNGTGKIVLAGAQWPSTASVGGGSGGAVTSTDASDYIYLDNMTDVYMGQQITFSGAGVMTLGLMMSTPYYITYASDEDSNILISDTLGGSTKDVNTVDPVTEVTFTIGGGGGGSGEPTNGDVLTWGTAGALTWSTPAGAGALNDLSDVMVMTPSTGQVLTYTMSGQWENQNAPSGGIASVSADTNPALGGNLDLADYEITNTLGNITIATAEGSSNIYLDTDTGFVYLNELKFPNTDGTSGQVLTTNGTGTLSFTTISGGASTLDGLTDVVITSVADGQILVYSGTNSQWENITVTGGLDAVEDDTAPVLGGNLDVGGNSIVSVSNGNIVLAPNGTGMTMLNNIEYHEKIHSLGTTSGTITPNVANGNVQTITLNGNLTLNAFTSPIAGQSLTLIVNTGGTSRTLTSTMKFAGASKTLSTTNTTDIISVFYDGTNYWASLSKDFK